MRGCYSTWEYHGKRNSFAVIARGAVRLTEWLTAVGLSETQLLPFLVTAMCYLTYCMTVQWTCFANYSTRRFSVTQYCMVLNVECWNFYSRPTAMTSAGIGRGLNHVCGNGWDRYEPWNPCKTLVHTTRCKQYNEDWWSGCLWGISRPREW